MKRFVCTAMTGVLGLCCTACGGTGDAGTVTVSLAEPFTMSADFVCGDLSGSAAISHYGTDAWDASFSAPDSLAGVTLSYLDGNVTASYKGLTFSVPQTAVPVKASLGQLFTVLEKAGADGTLDCVIEDGLCVIEGNLDAGSYTLTLTEQGAPASFAMPNLNLEMTFSGFSADGAPADTTPATGTTTAGKTDGTTAKPDAATTTAAKQTTAATTTAAAE